MSSSVVDNMSQSIKQHGTETIEKQVLSSTIQTGIIITGSLLPIVTQPISQTSLDFTNTGSIYIDCSTQIDTTTGTGRFCKKYESQKDMEKIQKDINLWVHPS